MKLKKRKLIAGFFVGCVPLFLVASGCNNTQQYNYQSAASMSSGVNTGHGSSESDDHLVASSASGIDASQSEPAVPQVSKPAIPEVSVGELLQNSRSYDKRKINVTGRKGALLTQYNMAYMINTLDKRSLAFYYEDMSSIDRQNLSNLGDLKHMTVSGIWDDSKKILYGEELVLSAK